LDSALKAVLEDNLTELDKVQEEWDECLGKRDETSRKLIGALSHMCKHSKWQGMRLKEQERQLKEQKWELLLQKEKLDRLDRFSWLLTGVNKWME
jgi:hypothetical protein